MIKIRSILLAVISLFLYSSTFAGDDEFSDYNKDIFGEPKAKATQMYKAWSRNMAYQIKHKIKEGKVVEGSTETKDYSVGSLGNVTIKEGAKITAPIVVNEDFSNATVIQRSRY